MSIRRALEHMIAVTCGLTYDALVTGFRPLSNVIKFTAQGRAVVGAVVESAAVRVSVADTGVGIRREDLTRLFEPFQQLDNPVSRGAGGTGLGLAISKKFVERHGGRIWAESRENQGSTFHFTLLLN